MSGKRKSGKCFLLETSWQIRVSGFRWHRNTLASTRRKFSQVGNFRMLLYNSAPAFKLIIFELIQTGSFILAMSISWASQSFDIRGLCHNQASTYHQNDWFTISLGFTSQFRALRRNSLATHLLNKELCKDQSQTFEASTIGYIMVLETPQTRFVEMHVLVVLFQQRADTLNADTVERQILFSCRNSQILLTG